MLVVAACVAIYGIYGYITKHNGSVDAGTSYFRIYSIFSSAPGLALFLSVLFPLAFYRASTLRGIKLLCVGVLICILLIAIGLTFARSALICVPLSCIVMISFVPSRKMKFGLLGASFMVATTVAIITPLMNIPIFSRFANQDITTLNNRTYLWQALFDHFDPTHLLGYGMKASDLLFSTTQISSGGLGVIATSVSNLYLGTLYDHGVIGLAFLLLLLLALGISLFIGIRKETGEQRALYVVALAVFINMIIQSFDTNDLWNQSIGLYFWAIMALPFAACWKTQPHDFTEVQSATTSDSMSPEKVLVGVTQ